MLVYGISSFEKTRYYDQEIFKDSFSHLYGRWKLYDITGGFSGGGTDDFTFHELEIRPYGIYGFYYDGLLIDYGGLTIHSSIDYPWVLTFDLDKNASKIAFARGLQSKFQFYLETDTLSLFPYQFSDAFNYHFERIQ
jgi:hypothetical protein